MSTDNINLLTCYNRGCGKSYDPSTNADGDCRYHPGLPFFHDAYKGWSCCNKKCTDFTEFLNFPGCTLSIHSNEKPPELPKPVLHDSKPEDVIEVKPIVASTLERPPFDSPMVTLKSKLAPSLKKEQFTEMVCDTTVKIDKDNIPIGTICKNGGCNQSYDGPESANTNCVHHPGCPIFHEGLKFWSCCQKRTSDFNAFLNQEGCEHGNHRWFSKENDTEDVKCRWDWHQTGSFVVLTVYAKQYSFENSTIEINPIRLNINLVFPAMNNANFNLDLELSKVIDVSKSEVMMALTKVEIKLRKAEPGSWSKLEIPRKAPAVNQTTSETSHRVESLTPQVDAVDLSDL